MTSSEQLSLLVSVVSYRLKKVQQMIAFVGVGSQLEVEEGPAMESLC